MAVGDVPPHKTATFRPPPPFNGTMNDLIRLEGRIGICKIVQVDIEKRYCTIKLFGRTFERCPWAMGFYDPVEGSGDDFIPRVNRLYLATYIKDIAIILSALPALDGSNGFRGNRRENLSSSDRVISANEVTRSEWKNAGIIKHVASSVCLMILSQLRNMVTFICENLDFKTAGGFIQWFVNDEDDSTDFTASFRKSSHPNDLAVELRMGKQANALDAIITGNADIRVTEDINAKIENDVNIDVTRDVKTQIHRNNDHNITNDNVSFIGNNNTVTIVNDNIVTIENDNTVDIQNDNTLNIENDNTVDIGNDSIINIDGESCILADNKFMVGSLGALVLHSNTSLVLRAPSIVFESIPGGAGTVCDSGYVITPGSPLAGFFVDSGSTAFATPMTPDVGGPLSTGGPNPLTAGDNIIIQNMRVRINELEAKLQAIGG